MPRAYSLIFLRPELAGARLASNAHDAPIRPQFERETLLVRVEPSQIVDAFGENEAWQRWSRV